MKTYEIKTIQLEENSTVSNVLDNAAVCSQRSIL
jgi:hypothetical protein